MTSELCETMSEWSSEGAGVVPSAVMADGNRSRDVEEEEAEDDKGCCTGEECVDSMLAVSRCSWSSYSRRSTKGECVIAVIVVSI